MKKKNISDAAACFLLCCLIGLFTVFSDDARQGAKSGIEICEGIIIPSLLPVLTVCNTIINSSLSRVFVFLFGKLFRRVFALPEESAGAVILGLIGGYPSGALLTLSLFERGVINSETAKRIMSFNLCGGAAFIITAVGTVTYGSIKTGLTFYIISVLSSLTVMLITGFTDRKSDNYARGERSYPPLSDAFCYSVESTVKSLALMSAFIVLFSVISGIINPPDYLIPLLEITNGVCGESLLPPQYAVFFLSFGGLCVHLQLFGILRKMRVSYPEFLTGRISCAVISFFYYKLYSFMFPESDAVFSNISSPVHTFSSGGLALSTVMILGCAVLIFDIENRKIKLHSQRQYAIIGL